MQQPASPIKEIRIWPLPIPKESREQLIRQAVLASNQRIDENGGITALQTEAYLNLWHKERKRLEFQKSPDGKASTKAATTLSP